MKATGMHVRSVSASDRKKLARSFCAAHRGSEYVFSGVVAQAAGAGKARPPRGRTHLATPAPRPHRGRL
eukprot:8906483-Alexandrium_andersonii.AAC.1